MADDWSNEYEWINALLKRLRDTELSDFEEQMKEAFRTSQETFRTDVAIALSNNIDHLNNAMNRLNQVLSTVPYFPMASDIISKELYGLNLRIC